MAEIYYSEGTSKISKGKGAWDDVGGSQVPAPKSPLPVGSHRVCCFSGNEL